VDLDPQRLDVVCPIRAAGEVAQVELNLVPPLVQPHGHGADEGLNPGRGLHKMGLATLQGGVWAKRDELDWKTGHLREHGAAEGLDPNREIQIEKRLGRIRGGFRENSGPGKVAQIELVLAPALIHADEELHPGRGLRKGKHLRKISNKLKGVFSQGPTIRTKQTWLCSSNRVI
jgi:hypothetical protein